MQIPPRPRTARAAALGIALARAGLGLAALVNPELVARPWVGEGGPGKGPAVLGRALGGRDLALGLGALAAGSDPQRLWAWVVAGGLADAVDATITVAAYRHLPRRGRVLVLAAAGGAAVAAALCAPSITDGGSGS
jgi:hypothetical protein